MQRIISLKLREVSLSENSSTIGVIGYKLVDQVGRVLPTLTGFLRFLFELHAKQVSLTCINRVKSVDKLPFFIN